MALAPMATPAARLAARHIQNFSEAATLVPHWGYADRALPCTNDAGSCEYLDVVYAAHDTGMLYTGVIWSTLAGILLVWGVWRVSSTPDAVGAISRKRQSTLSGLDRFLSATRVELRRRLLPDGPYFLFGRTSRIQIAVLAVLAGYLLIWSFCGIAMWKTWVTPVKASPGSHNTRTTLGPWADRVGVLAYALLPLSIMLASRESLLSLITGVPYHHFNFLHRWLGYIILAQSTLHTIGWTVIEVRLYQPQPKVALEWVKQGYIVWGIVAMIVLLLMFVFTLPFVIRRTGYEFFRKAHYIMAVLFIVSCWLHWRLLKCFLLPSLLLWAADRVVRLGRMFLLHYNLVVNEDGSTWIGFRQTDARAQVFADGGQDDSVVVRLDIDQPQTSAWDVGQHYFLTFTDSSIWQSHPFTPLSVPHVTPHGTVRHSYVFRAKSGETRKVARLLQARSDEVNDGKTAPTTGVLFTGPYGQSIVDTIAPSDNVMCVAGGTGVTFVLPVLLHLARTASSSPDRHITLVWVVRHTSDTAWVQPELDALARQSNVSIAIRILSTRDDESDRSSTPSTTDEEKQLVDATSLAGETALEKGCGCVTGVQAPASAPTAVADVHTKRNNHRPDLHALVQHFVHATTHGSTVVVASGPGSMLTTLRSAVAQRNSGAKVLRGQHDGDVRLIADDRLEW